MINHEYHSIRTLTGLSLATAFVLGASGCGQSAPATAENGLSAQYAEMDAQIQHELDLGPSAESECSVPAPIGEGPVSTSLLRLQPEMGHAREDGSTNVVQQKATLASAERIADTNVQPEAEVIICTIPKLASHHNIQLAWLISVVQLDLD